MPSLGADMEAGTVVEWLRKVGDTVHHGDVIAVVETHKGAIEVEVFEDGVVEEILVPPGEEVPVGTALAMIGDGSGASAAAAPKAPLPAAAPPMAGEVRRPDVLKVKPKAPVAAEEGRRRVSPYARRRAEALGVDLADVKGTGPGGVVQAVDVEQAAGRARASGREAPAAPPGRRRGFDPEAMRQGIAAAMAKSHREIPHYYLDTTIDMQAAMHWLEAANAERPVAQRLLYATLLIKATALALRKVPELNGFWIDGGARPAERVHIGWAIALRGGGLMAPAIHDADTMSLDALMAAMRDLVARARSGGIRGSEMTDPTITITNLGERGAEAVHGLIYPPQLALVGFGRLAQAPLAIDGAVSVRPVVRASLAGDHRGSDGHSGGLLLAAIDALLQKPEGL